MRKLMICLAITGISLLATSTSTALPPPCYMACCNWDDYGGECTTGGTVGITDCQWWRYFGGICP